MTAPKPHFVLDVHAKDARGKIGVPDDYHVHAYELHYGHRPGNPPPFEININQSVTEFNARVSGNTHLILTGGQLSARGISSARTRKFKPSRNGSSDPPIIQNPVTKMREEKNEKKRYNSGEERRANRKDEDKKKNFPGQTKDSRIYSDCPVVKIQEKSERKRKKGGRGKQLRNKNRNKQRGNSNAEVKQQEGNDNWNA